MNMSFCTYNARGRARAASLLRNACPWIVSAVLAGLAVGSVLALPGGAEAAGAQLARTTAPSATAPSAISPSTMAPSAGQGASSLESAASRAGAIGRKVAMSLIALGFAVAAIVLVFRRDFKEAAGVFVIGLLAVLLATPAGVDLLHGTVNTLFGS